MSKPTNKNIKQRSWRWLVPVAHVLGWVLFFSIPFFLRSTDHHQHMPPPSGGMPPSMPHNGWGGQHKGFNSNEMLLLSVMSDVVLVIVFYVNILFISPLFARSKQYGRYILMQVLIAIMYYYGIQFVARVIVGHHGPMFMEVFVYFIVVLATLCYSLVEENLRVERLQKEKETEALRSELSFLRWQISPHFLFNVLNNMVALAHVRSDKLERMLLNLSQLMRYMLYETDDKRITLEREATYINSYIELQRVRFGTEVDIQAEVKVEESCEDKEIEPMLFIPFIENAFKHGTGINDPFITIHLDFCCSIITMTVKNKYAEHKGSADTARGIGLQNVKRRLNLLYPGRHSLQIAGENEVYTVTLGINTA
jgi:two-component system LytT family sensor kinase